MLRVKVPTLVLSFSPVWSRLAGAVILLALIGGGWIWWSRPGSVAQTIVIHPHEFVQQVAVSGKVVAAQGVDLGFSQSGRIVGVYAKAGETAFAGTLIAQIENGDLRAVVLQKEAALSQEEAKLLSLKEGTRPESLAVSQAAVASAQSALDQANQALFNAISDAYRAGDDAVHNKVDSFLNMPRSNSPAVVFLISDQNLGSTLGADRVSAEAMLVSWNKEVAALDMRGDLSAAVDHARSNLFAVAALLSDANAALNHAITNSQYPQSAIDTYTANVASARTSVNAGLSALTAALSAQRSAQASFVSAQKSLALAQAGPTAADLAAQEAKVQAAQADLAQARASLMKTEVVAPFTGVVTRMDAKAGEIVAPSASLISMESFGVFQIEGYVPEINIALVKPAQSATVTLDAYGTGVSFAATVVSVDPAETIRDGVSTYRVVLQFARSDERIKSGMTANVVITAQKRENVISVPQGVVTLKDGRSVVQVKEGEKTAERAVTTGAISSLGEVEILSGLSDGDTIVVPAGQ